MAATIRWTTYMLTSIIETWHRDHMQQCRDWSYHWCKMHSCTSSLWKKKQYIHKESFFKTFFVVFWFFVFPSWQQTATLVCKNSVLNIVLCAWHKATKLHTDKWFWIIWMVNWLKCPHRSDSCAWALHVMMYVCHDTVVSHVCTECYTELFLENCWSS